MLTQSTIGETTDEELTAGQESKKGCALLREEIEALVAAVVFHLGLSQSMELLDTDFWGLDVGDELEIALIGSQECLLQRGQAVDSFLHWRPLGRRSTTPVLNLAVLFEEGDIRRGGFDAQDNVELVVHLDGDGTHLMLDTRTQKTHVEAIAHFSLVVAVQLATQERGNIGWFDSLDQGFQEIWIERLQGVLVLENQIGGVFGLHNAPTVLQFQAFSYRAVAMSEAVEFGVQGFDVQLGSQLIGQVEISDLEETIVDLFEGNTLPLQLIGQPIVSVEVEL